MRKAHPVLLALLVAAACTGVARADAAEADRLRHAQVDALFAPWSGTDTPGCAIGITRDGVLDYARGYGMSNLEYDAPITPDTVVHAASISKQFTAFAIGLLAEEGKLGLDDDVRRYVPELPVFDRPITLDHLVHHTNGLREQGQLLNLSGWRGDDIYTEDDILWALTRQRTTNFAAGDEVLYGNAAYTLLGLVVRRVSGQSLRDFADARIFAPLGMNATEFRDEHTRIVKGRAAAYTRRAEGGWQISVPNIDHYGSTSLQTTVGDLLRWQQNLMDARVGGPRLMAWMQTSGRLNDGTPILYGGGLRLAGYRGLRRVSHDGADGGYRAEASLFPDQRLAIVALCNGGDVQPTDLVNRVADLYLADQMTAPAWPAAVASAGTDPAALAGVYWSPVTDEIVRLEWKDGALRQAGTPAAFVAIGEGLYRPGDSPHQWRFVAPDGSRATQELRITDFWPTARVFNRVDAALPTDDQLALFTGRYHSQETATRYEVVLKDNRLRLTWPRGYDVALDAVGGDRFTGSRGTVTFTRSPSGQINGLTISNRRLRRLHAERIAATAPVASAGSGMQAP